MKPENFDKISNMMTKISSLEYYLQRFEKLDFNGDLHMGPKLVYYLTAEERVELNKRLRKDLQKQIDSLKNDLKPL